MPNSQPELSVVTGAFSYTGKYITQRLLEQGQRVRTLTGRTHYPHPFGDRVSVAPYSFNSFPDLVRSLEGAATLYNTYWVRFPYGDITFEQAVENSNSLIRAAQRAGVRRIVHISITSAAANSPLPYFRGKGLVEEAVRRSGMSYAILRPTVLFGHEDILINNIAWFLRRFPVFAVFGSGSYRIQPVHVEDLADLAVRAGQQAENLTMDAVGPETYTFTELIRLIARTVHSRAVIIHLEPRLAYALASLMGRLVDDVVLTWDEVQGLMAGLLVSDAPPTAPTRLSVWLRENADRLGTRYASELARHYRRVKGTARPL